MDADSEQNKKLLEEINRLIRIGRSAGDIEQELYMRGYDKPLLKDLLRNSFLELREEERYEQEEEKKQLIYEEDRRKEQEDKKTKERQEEARQQA